MKYLSGDRIRIGDLVWWNGGCRVGVVQLVVEDVSEMSAWGFAKPHIMVGNPPYRPDSDGYVAFAEPDFDCEGLMKLSEEEQRELETATNLAKLKSSLNFDHFECAVKAKVENSKMTAWIFNLLKVGGPDDAPADTICIPLNEL